MYGQLHDAMPQADLSMYKEKHPIHVETAKAARQDLLGISQEPS